MDNGKLSRVYVLEERTLQSYARDGPFNCFINLALTQVNKSSVPSHLRVALSSHVQGNE